MGASAWRCSAGKPLLAFFVAAAVVLGVYGAIQLTAGSRHSASSRSDAGPQTDLVLLPVHLSPVNVNPVPIHLRPGLKTVAIKFPERSTLKTISNLPAGMGYLSWMFGGLDNTAHTIHILAETSTGCGVVESSVILQTATQVDIGITTPTVSGYCSLDLHLTAITIHLHKALGSRHLNELLTS